MTSLKSWLHIKLAPPANQINISCVQIKRYLLLESEDFLCSNQKISCVRIKRFRVIESKDFLCSNQKISCALIRSFRVLKSRHLVCSNQDMSCDSVPTTRCPVFQSRHSPVPKQHHFSKIRPATYGRILANVPGFFQFVTRNGRILGRSPNSPKSGV